MTYPLYYDDATATEFEAKIVKIDDQRKHVVLDQTLFYPEGGGQPADRGYLDGVAVKDVQKGEDGVIVHSLAKPLESSISIGAPVVGSIDRAHRFDYMQQHSGQHVLSAALWNEAGAATVSVAQGSEVTSIEIDTDQLSPQQIAAVVDRANEAIRKNLPVRGFWITDAELSRYRLRRSTKRRGKIRLVQIGSDDHPYDLVACGGVHLPATALLNVVQLVQEERIRGHQRFHFKIGNRALADYREKHGVITEAAEKFSAPYSQLSERIDMEQKEVQELRRSLRIRAERIARYILTGSERTSGGIILHNEESDVFKALAEEATNNPRERLAALNIDVDKIHWAVIVGEDFPFPAERVRKEILAPLGAKGGGKAPLWRGIIPLGGDDGGDPKKLAARFVDAFAALW